MTQNIFGSNSYLNY